MKLALSALLTIFTLSAFADTDFRFVSFDESGNETCSAEAIKHVNDNKYDIKVDVDNDYYDFDLVGHLSFSVSGVRPGYDRDSFYVPRERPNFLTVTFTYQDTEHTTADLRIINGISGRLILECVGLKKI